MSGGKARGRGEGWYSGGAAQGTRTLSSGFEHHSVGFIKLIAVLTSDSRQRRTWTEMKAAAAPHSGEATLRLTHTLCASLGRGVQSPVFPLAWLRLAGSFKLADFR